MDTIFILDEHGRFLDINPAGLATIGYSREDLIASPGELSCQTTLPVSLLTARKLGAFGAITFSSPLSRPRCPAWPEVISHKAQGATRGAPSR